METNTIKVLWVEDDLGVYESFRNTAMIYGIEFIHADNWIDGKHKLKEQFNEISAIILDAQCKWDGASVAEDRFLNDVLSELWELFGEVRRTIPWYILSAGTMKNYAGVIESANSRKRQGYNEEWGQVSWKKVEVVSQFKENPLLSRILDVAKNQSHNIILSRHKDTFKYLGTEGNLCRAARVIMLNALSALYYPEENIGFEFQGNPIRKVLEHMLRHARSMGIIPDEFFDERNNPKVTDCKNFLNGDIPNYVKIQLWDPVKNEAFAIFPKPLSYYLQNVLNFVNSCSHTDEDDNVPYIIASSEKDLFFAMTLQLSHLIASYGQFIDSHRDVEQNKTLHKIIPTQIRSAECSFPEVETKPSVQANTGNQIEHRVEGPICIDNHGNAYIGDVQIKECFKVSVGKVFFTKKVYPNTGKYKHIYPYYTPMVFNK